MVYFWCNTEYMEESAQNQLKICPFCLNSFQPTKSRKQFCSITCKNKFVARRIDETKPEKECQICHKYKKFRFFSYNIRGNYTSGLKNYCKACGAVMLYNKRKARTWKDDAKKIMLMNCKYRAKKRGLLFNLDRSDLNILDRCPILNIPLYRTKRNNWDNSPSIDRINNNLGYIKGNVIVISKRANIIKKDATSDELYKIAIFYQNIYDEQIEYHI